MKYEIIYADFPWTYTSFGTAKLQYPSMSWESLKEFPWEEFMAKRCVILSWVTTPLLNKQTVLHEQWADRYRWRYLGVPFMWIKTKKDGTRMGASGPRPALVKPKNEFVVAYTNVRAGRTFPLLTESMSPDIYAPRGKHSEKPAVVRERIVELLGDRPRLELFARQAVEGWDSIGAESETVRIF